MRKTIFSYLSIAIFSVIFITTAYCAEDSIVRNEHETIVGRSSSVIQSSPVVTKDEELIGRSSKYTPPVSVYTTMEENIINAKGETVVGRSARIEQTVPVVTNNELLIGRSSKYKPLSYEPSTVIFVFSDDDAYRSAAGKIAPLCKTMPRVKSAVLDNANNVATLSVEPYEGSVETVVEGIKQKLKDELKLTILESRVRH